MRVQLLNCDAKLPKRASSGAAGFDICSSVNLIVPPSVVIKKRVSVGRALVSTGIAVIIPAGYVGKLGSRSGLSVKRNIEVGAGWVDPDYRGELFVELKNFGSKPFQVRKGDRISQLILLRTGTLKARKVDLIPSTKRGIKGFGSTGIK
jgi:dUTP pyrophosphatase